VNQAQSKTFPKKPLIELRTPLALHGKHPSKMVDRQSRLTLSRLPWSLKILSILKAAHGVYTAARLFLMQTWLTRLELLWLVLTTSSRLPVSTGTAMALLIPSCLGLALSLMCPSLLLDLIWPIINMLWPQFWTKLQGPPPLAMLLWSTLCIKLFAQ